MLPLVHSKNWGFRIFFSKNDKRYQLETMFYLTKCACSTSYYVVIELCISFESRDIAILTFRMMGVQKGSKKEGKILETFFLEYLWPINYQKPSSNLLYDLVHSLLHSMQIHPLLIDVILNHTGDNASQDVWSRTANISSNKFTITVQSRKVGGQ